jgi:hypothetical protein
VDWLRPELLAFYPLWTTINLCTTIFDFNKNFMASSHSNFFQGQMDKSLIYGPNTYEIYKVMPELLAKNPQWIANNMSSTIFDFKDYMANTLSNFFHSLSDTLTKA